MEFNVYSWFKQITSKFTAADHNRETKKLSDLNQKIIFETCSQQTNYIWLI